jgi:hypothetical protein
VESKQYSLNAKIILCIAILFIGLRPVSYTFGDMPGYAAVYEKGFYTVSKKGEPVWSIIETICHDYLELSTTLWFVVISWLTIGLHYLSYKKLFGGSLYTGLLFLFTSFFFFSSTTNIIRSGMGMALALYGITLFIETAKLKKIVAILLFILAFNTHHSTAVLVGCFVISYFFVRNIKWSICIYVLCVVLSLSMDHYFEIWFSSLNLDDRMARYTTNVDYTGFSHSGFRWDFLVYSIVPILLGWYLMSHKQIKDKVYSFMLNTYVLSNAFWVLVIRAQFSDRYAGISWTIYPIVIAYPLIKFYLWNDQPSKVKFGLMCHCGFLWLMQFYYLYIK